MEHKYPSDMMSDLLDEWPYGEYNAKKLTLHNRVKEWLQFSAIKFQDRDIKVKRITNPNDMVVGEFYLLKSKEARDDNYLMYLWKISPIGSYLFIYRVIYPDKINFFPNFEGGGDDKLLWDIHNVRDKSLDDYRAKDWDTLIEWAEVYRLEFGVEEFKIFLNWNKEPLIEGKL